MRVPRRAIFWALAGVLVAAGVAVALREGWFASGPGSAGDPAMRYARLTSELIHGQVAALDAVVAVLKRGAACEDTAAGVEQVVRMSRPALEGLDRQRLALEESLSDEERAHGRSLALAELVLEARELPERAPVVAELSARLHERCKVEAPAVDAHLLALLGAATDRLAECQAGLKETGL